MYRGARLTPADLTSASFAGYEPAARAFALAHLRLLQRLPMSLCPSVLEQVQRWATAFPVEQVSLEKLCGGLEQMSAAQGEKLLAPFRAISIPVGLQQIDWVNDPTRFLAEMSGFLWASGEIEAMRRASSELFAAMPPSEDDSDRMTLVIFGRGGTVAAGAPVFQKLRRHGLLLTNFHGEGAAQAMVEVVEQRARHSRTPYGHWYVDGGEPLPVHADAGVVVASYPGLAPVRQSVLGQMRQTIADDDAGAEQMHTRLSALNPKAVGAGRVTDDPVLERFYTELFTSGSGTQIFSTSFVQWTGRELARRARPRTMLLRYAPRQRPRLFNDMIRNPVEGDSLDPDGSLRDGDMGAYYAWLEMRRITAPGHGTFVAWLEGTKQLMVLGANAPAGTATDSAIDFHQLLADFT